MVKLKKNLRDLAIIAVMFWLGGWHPEYSILYALAAGFFAVLWWESSHSIKHLSRWIARQLWERAPGTGAEYVVPDELQGHYHYPED